MVFAVCVSRMRTYCLFVYARDECAVEQITMYLDSNHCARTNDCIAAAAAAAVAATTLAGGAVYTSKTTV